MLALYVGLGGFFGTLARYGVYLLLRSSTYGFPWATLAVNVVGCFLIGCVYFWNQHHGAPNSASLIISTGFLGGFTTFSAFGIETFRLMQDDQLLLAGTNVLANVLLGLAAIFVARLFF